MIKEVAIITYDMIPHTATWGGCQRMYYLSEYMGKRGIKVTVFSCKKGSFNNYGNLVSFKNIAIEIRNPIYKSLLMSKGRTEISKEESHGKLVSILYKLRKFVKSNKSIFRFINSVDKWIYNEPGSLAGFISRSWISSSKGQILDYIRENNVRNVIISAPPFGLFCIAEYIRKNIGSVNIIFDYRDPWNLWKENGVLGKVFEKKYLKQSNHIVCTNNNLALAMSNKFGIDMDKFEVVENGYSIEAWEHISDIGKLSNEFMVITYVGVMDLYYSSQLGYRDISILLKAFEACLSEGKKVVLRFVGITNTNSDYAKFLREKFKENIQFVGVLDNKDSNAEMIKSDVLLLLHTVNDNSSKYLISGKMYDYIRAKRMILSIGSSDGLHRELIESEKIGVSCENNYEEIYKSIKYLYSLWENGELSVDKSDTYRFSRNYQNEKYIKLLIE